MEWCIHNKFEFVELGEQEDGQTEEFGKVCYGMDRVIEALHAHTWPTMILKGFSLQSF